MKYRKLLLPALPSLPGWHVPNIDRCTVGTSRQGLAIGGKGKLRDRAHARGHKQLRVSADKVTEIDASRRTKSDLAAVGEDGKCNNPTVVPGELAHLVAGSHLPNPDRFVIAAGDEMTSVRREGESQDGFLVPSHTHEFLARGAIPQARSPLASAEAIDLPSGEKATW